MAPSSNLVPCPEHTPDGATGYTAIELPNGFTECRACWYGRWLRSTLRWAWAHRLDKA